jgi:hypothetical protein
MFKIKVEDSMVYIIVIIITSIFIYLNINHEMNPRSSKDGWNGWADQSKYYLSAISLYNFDFASDKHWYPIGYSAISAPFIILNKYNPFIYVNAISLTLYSYFFLKYFKNNNIAIVSLIAGLFLFVQTSLIGKVSPVIEAYIFPWNTVIISAAYLYLILLTREIKDNAIKIGLVCGLIIFVRAVDILPVVPFIIIGLILQKFYLNLGAFVKTLLKIFFSSLVFIIPLTLFNYILHGNVYGGAYTNLSINYGLGFDNLIDRFYWVFISPEAVWNDGPGVFKVFPYLLIIIPFFLIAVFSEHKKYLQPSVLIFFSLLLYLSYNDFSPHNVLRFRVIHYISWTIPVLLCIGLIGLMSTLKTKAFGKISLSFVFIVGIASTDQIVVGQNGAQVTRDGDRYVVRFNTPADIDGLDLIGDFDGNWMNLTTSDLEMRVDGKLFHVFNGYKATPTINGVRIIFNKNINPKEISFVVIKIISPLLDQDIKVIPVNYIYKL